MLAKKWNWKNCHLWLPYGNSLYSQFLTKPQTEICAEKYLLRMTLIWQALLVLSNPHRNWQLSWMCFDFVNFLPEVLSFCLKNIIIGIGEEGKTLSFKRAWEIKEWSSIDYFLAFCHFNFEKFNNASEARLFEMNHLLMLEGSGCRKIEAILIISRISAKCKSQSNNVRHSYWQYLSILTIICFCKATVSGMISKLAKTVLPAIVVRNKIILTVTKCLLNMMYMNIYWQHSNAYLICKAHISSVWYQNYDNYR